MALLPLWRAKLPPWKMGRDYPVTRNWGAPAWFWVVQVPREVAETFAASSSGGSLLGGSQEPLDTEVWTLRSRLGVITSASTKKTKKKKGKGKSGEC